MKRRSLRRTYGVLSGFQAALAGLGTTIPLTLRPDLAWIHATVPFVETYLVGIRNTAWCTAPLAVLLAGAVGVAKRRLGDPARWQAVHEVLTIFREQIFKGANSPRQQDHRVTLFKHYRFLMWPPRWPITEWLKPVERSGHTSQNSKTLFRAPSDDADLCEGIAGLAWCEDKSVHQDQLPDVCADSATDSEFERYARQTNMNIDQVKQLRPRARSFYAIRVEVKNEPWGVIVIDSRDERFATKSKMNTEYQYVGRLLAKQLEGL